MNHHLRLVGFPQDRSIFVDWRHGQRHQPLGDSGPSQREIWNGQANNIALSPFFHQRNTHQRRRLVRYCHADRYPRLTCRSVTWYRDLIISKCAAECKIVLWRIENFDSSSEEVPPHAPTTHEFRPTRSAFGGTYQRLLQFEASETTPFYVRFSLFTAPQARPILAIGNEKSKIFFWDLQSLEDWSGNDLSAVGAGLAGRKPDRSRGGRPTHRGGRGKGGRRGYRRGVARVINTKQRELDAASSAAVDGDGHERGLGSVEHAVDFVTSRPAQGMHTAYPFQTMLHHKYSVVPRVTFASRQVAWSVGGEWMVVVGDQGMIALFTR